MKWLKSTKCVSFEISDQVARITLDRPDKRNALSALTLRELNQALLEADDRRDANVILLSGAGRDFWAGYDLGDDAGILATHKRVVNAQLELCGAKQSMRYAAGSMPVPISARGASRALPGGHGGEGLKEALTNRDAPFGRGRVELRARRPGE